MPEKQNYVNVFSPAQRMFLNVVARIFFNEIDQTSKISTFFLGPPKNCSQNLKHILFGFFDKQNTGLSVSSWVRRVSRPDVSIFVSERFSDTDFSGFGGQIVFKLVRSGL